jgi:hypothetical protein
MADAAIDFRRERERRIGAEMARLRSEIDRIEERRRMQVVDSADADAAVCSIEAELLALERELDEGST